MKKLLLATAACAAFASQAHASVIATANLFSPTPPTGSVTTPIAIQSAPIGSATYNGAGFTITYSSPFAADQGIVSGSIPSSTHATPVAGVQGGTPTYLSGDFGSAQTTNPNTGKYLSTGGAGNVITITFNTAQTSLALLWGSIDTSNQIRFLDGANGGAGDTLTGTTVQGLATGFAGNGFQGPAGSAYVTATTSASFTQIQLTSGVVSFEAAGIAGSTAPFNVPEPASIALLGAGLVGVGAFRRRRAK